MSPRAEPQADGYGSWYLELSDDEREALGFALDAGMRRVRDVVLEAVEARSLGLLGDEARNLFTLGRLRLRLRDMGGDL